MGLRRTGERESVLAEYVLGCDGADSLVRRAIGASMLDLRFAQRWLVVDVDVADELGEWEGVHQVCDPNRPATYMRVGKRRHRWEFRLPDGGSAEDYQRMDDLHPLIAPWTKDTPVERMDLVRVADYTFRAGIADRWRRGRVLILGDAAHLTPPFIGQGIGAGLRDAANLAWKLAGVVHGTLPEDALDSYQEERLPHARTMIRLAKLVGVAMTGGGETGRLVRRVVAPRLRFVPGLRERVLSSETPPLSSSGLVLGGRFGRGLAGSLCPNARLDDGRRFDAVASGRFAVVTAPTASGLDASAVEDRGAVAVAAAPGGALHDWLRRGRATAAIVRPDGTVMAAGCDPRRLVGVLIAAVAPGSAWNDR
jgi:3-(3-hydroxy-phenyl)propionate hydroxylase